MNLCEFDKRLTKTWLMRWWSKMKELFSRAGSSERICDYCFYYIWILISSRHPDIKSLRLPGRLLILNLPDLIWK